MLNLNVRMYLAKITEGPIKNNYNIRISISLKQTPNKGLISQVINVKTLSQQHLSNMASIHSFTHAFKYFLSLLCAGVTIRELVSEGTGPPPQPAWLQHLICSSKSK